jgi:hypothetical protein
MDQVHSSSDLHRLVPVIAGGGAAMTGSVRDPKLHAETQAEKADSNKFQQRLTCPGPASTLSLRKVRTMKTSAWFGTILN